jgi:S1-C subfamily serine protease
MKTQLYRTVLLAAILAAFPIVAFPAELSPEQLFKKASPAVVLVGVSDNEAKGIGLGSGFLVSPDGLIVTNYHVIEGAYSADVRLPNGNVYRAQGVVAVNRCGA